MSITPGTLRAVQQLRAGLAGVVDAQARDLVAAWAAAWDEVAGELRDAVNDLVDAAAGGRVTKAQIGRSGRLLAALAHITDQLVGLAAAAGVRVTADLAGVVEQAGAAQVAAIGSQLPFGGQERVVTWDRVDRAAVNAIVSRTAEAITAASRPLGGDAARAVRRELVRGVVVGDNPRAVARRIVTRAGAGFHGGLTRALVISRTEMADASRAASRAADLANKDVLTGWVWQASLGPRTCPACWAMHGTVHALTDPGPLGHPQCVLPGAVVSGPAPTASTARWFDGQVVEVETVDGHLLTVTPNHPILTPYGWVSAGHLRERDQVVTGAGTDGPPFGGCPDDHQRPALIEDVAKSLGGSSPVRAVSMPTAAEDFHGDGVGSHIHVVRTHGLLDRDDHPAATQFGGQPAFVLRDVGLQALPSGGGPTLLLERLGLSPGGFVSGDGVESVLFRRAASYHQLIGDLLVPPLLASVVEHPLDVSTGDAQRLGQGKNGLSRGVPLAYPMPSREEMARFAGSIATSSIRIVSRRSWSGHVYNLQTPTGWYVANGILTHNCRCTRTPVARTWAELGFPGVEEPPSVFPDAAGVFAGMSPAEQQSVLGPARYTAWRAGEYPMGSWAARRSNPGWRDSYQVSPAPARASRAA